MPLPLRVAVVGAGPAGIYAADILTKSDPDADGRHLRPDADPVRPDPVRRRPRPPADQADHRGAAPGDGERADPVLRQRPRRRRRQARRAAAVLRRGHLRHRRRAGPHAATIPGIDLPRSYGAADFVAFYDSHPDRDADLGPVPGRARSRSSASATSAWTSPGCSPAPPTSCSTPRSRGTCTRRWRDSAVTDVHMFARRGPAQAKFTPVELRELDHSPNVQVVVVPEGMEFDGRIAGHARQAASRCGWSSTCSATGRCATRSRARTAASTSTSWRTRSRSSAPTARSSGCAPSGRN